MGTVVTVATGRAGPPDRIWYNHGMGQARAKLSEIVDAIDMTGEETYAYFDRQTGAVEIVSEEDMDAARDEESAADAPEWQQGAIDMARQIESAPADRFVPLPDQFEAHEWDMMRKFVFTVEDEAISDELQNAIHGAGAFRMFKACIHRLDISDQWYAFRGRCYRELAKEWCRANGIEWEPDDGAQP